MKNEPKRKKEMVSLRNVIKRDVALIGKNKNRKTKDEK